jgi:LacI family transcriptional regulator
MKNKNITIKDVARVAGVSTQTVSRVMNERPDVSANTRTHVKEVIDSLGYSPNAFARNLSRGRSSTLGVVGYGLEYYGSSTVLTGIESKTNELGYSLTLSLIDQYLSNRVEKVLYDFLSRRVEGIIWAVPANVNNFKWLEERFSKIKIPSIFINRGPTDLNFVAALDNKTGGKLATEHLITQGYKRIGIITGPLDWWEAKERLAGWQEVVLNANYSNTESLIVEGGWDPPSGDVGLHTLLDRDPNIDAVFVSNDQMALGAMQAARRLGLEVPKDLGIVGFDDIPEAAYFYPSLTTIRQNTRKFGAQTVERLIELIKAQQSGESISPDITWLEPRLIIRNSSKK